MVWEWPLESDTVIPANVVQTLCLSTTPRRLLNFIKSGGRKPVTPQQLSRRYKITTSKICNVAICAWSDEIVTNFVSFTTSPPHQLSKSTTSPTLRTTQRNCNLPTFGCNLKCLRSRWECNEFLTSWIGTAIMWTSKPNLFHKLLIKQTIYPTKSLRSLITSPRSPNRPSTLRRGDSSRRLAQHRGRRHEALMVRNIDGRTLPQRT